MPYSKPKEHCIVNRVKFECVLLSVEVKLGSNEIEEAAIHLKELKDKVNSEKMGSPSFMMVLTGGQYAYRSKDGVLSVPIGCLKP